MKEPGSLSHCRFFESKPVHLSSMIEMFDEEQTGDVCIRPTKNSIKRLALILNYF
jgi:hypothetical protein